MVAGDLNDPGDDAVLHHAVGWRRSLVSVHGRRVGYYRDLVPAAAVRERRRNAGGSTRYGVQRGR